MGTFFTLGNVPPFILYTHVPAGIISLLIAFFIVRQGRRGESLPHIILAISLSLFSFWVFANVIIWGTNRSDIVMFLWSLQILFEPMVYMGIGYMVYVLLYGRDVPFRAKMVIGLIFFPFALIIPTQYNLFGFNLNECIPVETYYAFFSYFLEIISVGGIILICIRRYQTTTERAFHRTIITLGIGSILFLLAFASGNIFGSFTGEWVKTQFGLFGMPIFAAILGYLVVRYKIFNVRIIATQMLVVGAWLLLFSLVFVRRTDILLWILVPTLLVFGGVGFILVRSVKREVEQRERLQKVTDELERTNTQLAEANEKLRKLDQAKTEFLSITSHQLRTPLTGIKGYLSMILEGDFGKFTKKQDDVLSQVSAEVDRLARMVQVFLNVSRIESGRLIIARLDIDLVELIKNVIKELSPLAEKKGLKLSYEGPDQYLFCADSDKLKDVVMNLIDNAIKYTQKGWVKAALDVEKRGVQIRVSDSGIGMDAKGIEKLFQKFSRGQGIAKVNADGSGLGLFIVKKIVEAHGGEVWAESKGKEKGSTFAFRLPAAKPVQKG